MLQEPCQILLERPLQMKSVDYQNEPSPTMPRILSKFVREDKKTSQNGLPIPTLGLLSCQAWHKAKPEHVRNLCHVPVEVNALSYDAITSPRAYRISDMSPDRAISFMMKICPHRFHHCPMQQPSLSLRHAQCTLGPFALFFFRHKAKDHPPATE